MRSKPQSGQPGRLEGMVVQKRLGRVETTRYLVLDLKTGHICIYRNPPPATDSALQKQKPKSPASKVKASLSSIVKSNNVSRVTELEDAYLALTHINRDSRPGKQRRQTKIQELRGDSWEPKIVVPPNVDWKIRDVENDETTFYLVLPADFDPNDSGAEVFTMSLTKGKSVAYRSSTKRMKSLNENEETFGNSTLDSPSQLKSSYNDSDDASVSSTSSTSSKSSILSKVKGSLKKKPKEKQEIIYQFRCLLDGNEKFIWLQAAAEMNRLAEESAVSIIGSAGTAAIATKKLFVLPSLAGGGKANETALRYAEWARLVDQEKSVSGVDFCVKTTVFDALDDSDRHDSTRLIKICPSYAYRNRRMTEKELFKEMATNSENWEDFRQQTVGDRDEEMIGSLHAEVLACHGLPKLDKFTNTDAVCYFVCGPFAFATDVIDGFCSPVWPSKSRRACIFPLFYAYQELYVGVFDDDGAGQNDDFAGRVVVDVSRLRPNSEYDVYLPLRMYRNTHVKQPRGVIHLRLRVEWHNEKKAVMSYFKLPKKTKHLGNSVTLNCADLKAFRNVVLTVQGKDVPGRWKQLVQKGIQREMKLYKFVMKTFMKEQMKSIVLWVHPTTSFPIFLAWMHCVYSNSFHYVPVYILLGIIVILVENYITFAMNRNRNAGFTPITVGEMMRALILGGPNTNYIQPINVTPQAEIVKSLRGKSDDELDQAELTDQVLDGAGIRMDDDHLEFPFSEAGRYPKKTLAEGCVDASTLFEDDDDDDDGKSSGKIAALKKMARPANMKSLLMMNRDDGEDEDEKELGLDDRIVDDIAEKAAEITEKGLEVAEKATDIVTGTAAELLHRPNPQSQDASKVPSPTFSRKGSKEVPVDSRDLSYPHKQLWKRVTDTRGLPEQDASVFVKSRKTLKEEIIHNKNLLHKMSNRLFDDRMFIVNEEDPGYNANEELVLNNAIGTNKHKNPMVAKMAEYIGPALEGIKVGLSVWRAGFNLFTWSDPFLTFLFLCGCICLMCILFVFPWRIFFFLMGVGALGPQNYFVGKVVLKKKAKAPPSPPAQSTTPKRKNPKGQAAEEFQFHNHLLTHGGIDLREEKSAKSTSSVHRAIVPTSPLISRRFFDWPPNPSLSKVEVFSK